MIIRAETPADAPAVRRVNEAAFGQMDEADLFDRLRRTVASYLALVAEENGEVVGHIAFTRVRMDPPRPSLAAYGLAPMTVMPDVQRSGIGSRLVIEGLDACRRAGGDAVFVLGHADYYPRFGFEQALLRGIDNEFGAPSEVFFCTGAGRGHSGWSEWDGVL